MNTRTRFLSLGLAALGCLALPSSAQTLLGSDGINMQAWEFTPATGNPCPQPTPMIAACGYTIPFCGLTGPGVAQPGSMFGDIADDPLTDTFYLTDGFIIEQYTLDAPCAGPMNCAPLNAFLPPTFLGPITGMGFDNTGGVVAAVGTPLLWVTDGFRIAALTPGAPGSCAATVVFGPCTPVIPGGAPMTDISWDPTTGTLWVCDAGGRIHNLLPPGCVVLSTATVAGSCGLGAGLTGIAYDGGTPPAAPTPPAPPAVWVTDGNTVAHLTTAGLPYAPTFPAPSACNPTPTYLNGLALTQHAIRYGNSRVAARLRSVGQASTPGPTFALEVTAAPPATNAWLILNFNVPGPGFLCPPAPGGGTKLWVNPTPPGSINFLGPIGSPCTILPSPIPGALPIGAETYAQIVFTPFSGPPAVDATNAIMVTFMQP